MHMTAARCLQKIVQQVQAIHYLPFNFHNMKTKNTTGNDTQALINTDIPRIASLEELNQKAQKALMQFEKTSSTEDMKMYEDALESYAIADSLSMGYAFFSKYTEEVQAFARE